ncbi:MAG: tetratricopeptide repeat protein [Candidatus Rokubacteria bacterium]|nr:tetratricopeptide repeat protein [Candidatus Rokubacteria bacterium]
MRCPRCEHDNPAGVKFCGECGARLEFLCPACRASNPPTNKFCHGCGAPLHAAAPGAKFAEPHRYTPRHLAEKILTSRSAVEGERKQVTVLFADLKGSMELLADRDPEEARKLLDPVLERMMEAVHRYEGTVNQVLGDGIMALFGAPLAHEDHAVRACYAALRMQESVTRYGDEIQRSQGVPVQIRVGLNSGEVVVRSIGSDLHMDYTAVGQTTHLAARMEQMAKPGSVLATAHTLKLAEGYVQIKPLGPVSVKGLEGPIEVYEILGAEPVRSRLQAAAVRGLTRFVGREAELDQLCKTMEQARAGHGQVVAVVGEPGVGKSRLFYEFIHSPRTRAWLVLESASVSYGKATAYLPLIELLKDYFKVENRDDIRTIRERVTGKVLTLDRTLEETIPAVLALIEALPEDSPFRDLDPPQRRQRTLDAVKRLLLRESQVQLLCLVFEDLHWTDSETQALLDALIESLPTARVLLLANYRPEYQHGWGSKTYYTQLRMDPLPPESAQELLEALLGSDAGLQSLKALLIDRTEGNPFFLEESVRTLVETKVLVGERGAYRLAKALERIQVPPTVQAVLAARVDRLPLDEKRLLQSAAVIGKDAPYSLLKAIAELPEEILRSALMHLQAAEFLYETSLFPELEYTFKHALTHEVAYGSLLHDQRRGLHTRIVEAIESLYADRLPEQVERLAHHALRGEVWGKAFTYLRQAGDKAKARSANREAVACFEQALSALAHLPENRDTLERAIDLRFDLRDSLFPLGEFDRVYDSLREAETLAQSIGDQRRLGRASSHMSQYFWLVGDMERAIESGQRALAVANAMGDTTLQVATNLYLGLAHHARGDYRQAMDVLRGAVESMEEEPLRERWGRSSLFVHASAWLGLCLAELGEFAEGIARGEGAVRVAEAVDRPFDRVTAYFGVGHLHLRKGNFERAISILERTLPLVQAGSFVTWFASVASSLGYAYSLSGRLAEAMPLLEQAASRKRSHFRLRLAYLAEAYLQAGRIDEAMPLARRSLDLSQSRRERGHEAWALRLVGEIASKGRPPDLETSETSYRQAITLANDSGMRPLLAHCHLGLGRTYGRAGNRSGAEEHLTTATALFREMDMRFWREQAEAELRGLEESPGSPSRP